MGTKSSSPPKKNDNQNEKKHEPLFVKPPIPELKFDEYTVTPHELALGNKPTDERIYLVFDPHNQTDSKQEQKKQSNIEYNAVIFLFHGTNEMCYDTELIEQLQKDNPKYTWMDLAIKNNILLIYPQSETEKYNDKNPDCFILDFRNKDQLRAVWTPYGNDKIFIHKLKTNVLENYNIKHNKTYAIGYSNGGIFLLNLLLDYPYLFDLNVSWGGGLEMSNVDDHKINTQQLDEELQKELKNIDKDEYSKYYVGKWSFYFVKLAVKKCESRCSKIVIMTGTMDDNRTPSYRAWLLFKRYSEKYELRFEDFRQAKHQYRSDATKHIWDCFNNFYDFQCIEEDDVFQF